MFAILAIGSFALIPNLSNADTRVSSIWVRLNGFINSWGNDSVFGWLRALAFTINNNGTTNEWASVNALWSNQTVRLNVTQDAPGTFTFSYYMARLVNTSMIDFNSSGYDLYISGLWNVSKITTTLTISPTAINHLVNFTRTDEQILGDAQGYLALPNQTPRFELNITGIDVLTGYVAMSVLQFKQIQFFDVAGPNGVPDGKVDIHDLVRVARAYGTVVGMSGYSFDMDFNLAGRIDIFDLTTIAANIQG